MEEKMKSALTLLQANDGRSFFEITQDGLGQYKFIRVLHLARYSVVMKMLDQSSNSFVTVKFRTKLLLQKRPIWVTQMALEAYVLSQMKSHRVPRYVSFDICYPYLVLEYFSGRDFSKYKALKRDFAINVVKLISEPLSELHELGFLHCDIKPHNMILTSSDKVKLIDFGTVCGILDGDARTVSSKDVLGTKGYMAPELKTKLGGYTPATDVYGLTTTLFSLITGLKLELEEVEFLEVLHRERERLNDQKLYDLMLRGADPDPAKRFQNIKEFKRSLLE